MEVLEVLGSLARKDGSWWAWGERRAQARALADVWAARTPAPADAVLPWPDDHGIALLLMVLAEELQRGGLPHGCPEWDTVAGLL